LEKSTSYEAPHYAVQSPVTSPLFSPNILLNTLFTNTHKLEPAGRMLDISNAQPVMLVWRLTRCLWEKMLWEHTPHSLHESAVCSKQWCNWYHSVVGYCLQKKERKKISSFISNRKTAAWVTMSATDIIRSGTLFSTLKVFNNTPIALRKFIAIPFFCAKDLRSQWRIIEKLFSLQFIIIIFVYRNHFNTNGKYLFILCKAFSLLWHPNNYEVSGGFFIYHFVNVSRSVHQLPYLIV
jgi:hypothetical protein